MSEYDIQVDEDDPDFTYETDDLDEKKHAEEIIILFAMLYANYQNKSLEYIVENISKDLAKIEKEINIKSSDNLKTIFRKMSDELLLDAGILKANLKKANIKVSEINHLIKEQKLTLNNICNELKGNIKSKAEYLKNRLSENVFSVKNNFRKAANRLKTMVESGFSHAVSKAKRVAIVFLYNDPLSSWVTAGDARVCIDCRTVEAASPMPLSKLPFCPLHNHCRCEIIHEKDLIMTEEALKLTMYDLDDGIMVNGGINYDALYDTTYWNSKL